MKKLCMIAMLAIALALAALPAAAETRQSVKYLDADGIERSSPENTIIIDSDFINSQSGNYIALKKTSDGGSDWYAVTGTVEANKYIDAIGTVNLILCDGATLKANQGIQVIIASLANPGKLTIYAQSTGSSMGKLVSDNPSHPRAGITVYSGQTLTINGGDIQAKGYGRAAGIGGNGGDKSCGAVIINGGKVTAVSDFRGAGIGGGGGSIQGAVSDADAEQSEGPGESGGTVTITGGTVIAQGADGAPAIGAGKGSGNPDHGSLFLKPKAGKGLVATNKADSSQIGVFESSDANRISSFTGENHVTYVEITGYESAAVDAVTDAIDKLDVDPGSYTPGDSAVDQAILDANSALEALSNTDKAFVSIGHKEKLAALLEKLNGEYILIEGAGQRVTESSTAPMSFRASGPLAWFTGILVDGEAVARDCYTSRAGSTVVTLNPGYVAKLAAGTHTLTFKYSNGRTVNTSFEVVPSPEAAQLPQTGDRSSLLLWAVLMLMCAGGAAVPWARDRRR